MIGSLETERSGLEREVEKLRSFEREYRSRLKSYLEGQLRELDGRTGEAGAAAATGQQSGQSPAQQSPGQPARSPFAPGAPVGGDSPSGPPQQPQGFGEG
jgi:hypothetical protein